MSEEQSEITTSNPPPHSKMKSELQTRSLSTWTPSRHFRASMLNGRFCCCFSLQAGVTMYSAMGLVLMISAFILNIGAELHELDRGSYLLIQFSILYTYVLSMTAGLSLTYFGAVKPSLKCLKIGNWIVCIVSVFWFIISIVSFTEDPKITHTLCINRRCPETLWLVKTYFRVYGDDCNEEGDMLLGDEDLNEDYGEKEDKEKGINYKLRNKTSELGETGIQEEPDGSSISLDDPLVYHFDYGSQKNESHSNKSKIAEEDEKSNVTNGTDPKPVQPNRPEVMGRKGLYKIPALKELELVSFESRLIGCTSSPKLYRALSIFAMTCWTLFLVHGMVGAFLLIREVNRMTETGEINRALTHLSYAQEQQERQSRKIKEESTVVLKEATPAGGGYAGFFSLQAGTVLTSTCIFGVALITFFYNLSAPNDSNEKSEYVTQYVLVYSYVSLAFIGAGIVSTFAFKKNPKWLLVGSIIVTCSSIYWFTMSLLSFFPSLGIFKYLCIMDRCPPTHWIFEVPWRNDRVPVQELDDLTTTHTPYTSDGTPANDSRDDISGSPTTPVSTADVTTPIDLNSGATHPPNATGTLVGDCDRLPTISNEYLNKELHDIKVIERMKKKTPTNIGDDEGDHDTRMDNTLYDLPVDGENHWNKSSVHPSPGHGMEKEVTAPPRAEAESSSASTSITTSTTEPSNDITSEATMPEANTAEASSSKTRGTTNNETAEIEITNRPTAEISEIETVIVPTAVTSENKTTNSSLPVILAVEMTDRPTADTSVNKTTITPTAETTEIEFTNRPTSETFDTRHHLPIKTTNSPTAETSETEVEHMPPADDLFTYNEDVNVYMVPLDTYPEPTEAPEEIQKRRDKMWGVKKFMSSVELIYSEDMFGGNLAMSIISFVSFSVFLVYGLLCMFYMYKRMKRRQREREMEDEDEDEASIASLQAHPSRKSQRSQ